MARAAALEPLLDRHRDEAVAEELGAVAAGRGIAAHKNGRAVPRSTERRVDTGLAHRRSVEPEVVPLASRDGVVQDAVARPRARVHADEDGRIAALLKELGVPSPGLLHDSLAAGVEELRDERVEASSPSRRHGSPITTTSLAPATRAPARRWTPRTTP